MVLVESTATHLIWLQHCDYLFPSPPMQNGAKFVERRSDILLPSALTTHNEYISLTSCNILFSEPTTVHAEAASRKQPRGRLHIQESPSSSPRN